jgi:hypothetical protein
MSGEAARIARWQSFSLPSHWDNQCPPNSAPCSFLRGQQLNVPVSRQGLESDVQFPADRVAFAKGSRG